MLVQFGLFDFEQIDIVGTTAFLGLNGSGKTSVIDGMQTVMLGAHGSFLSFNAKADGGPTKRNLREYCLGAYEDSTEGSGSASDSRHSVGYLREHATTYVSLVFRDEESGIPITAGVSISASISDPDYEVNGLYVVGGVVLELTDHIEVEGSGEREQRFALAWPDFRERISTLAQNAGEKAFITDRPAAYVQQLLHVLQGSHAHIDVSRYLRVFKKALQLRLIESVSDYVRDYLIGEERINLGPIVAQIHDLRKLYEIIRRVEEQIGALEGIDTIYRRALQAARRAAAYTVLHAECEHGAAVEYRARLERERDQKKAEHDKAQQQRSNVTERLKERTDELERLRALTSADEAKRRQEKLLGEKQNAEKLLAREHAALHTFALRLVGTFDRGALRSDMNADLVREMRSQANGLRKALDMRDVDEAAQSLGAKLDASRDLAQRARSAVEQRLKSAQAEVERVQTALAQAQGKVKNLRRGGSEVSDDVARLIESLEARGIEARPVCDLVQIVDRAWQPAIEAFLKRNRESLVVAPGREREAVAIARALPRERAVFGIVIVQPNHLHSLRWDERDATLVGNLVRGANDTAVRYVRRLLGRMRRAHTEAELEQYDRALTIDGMLSANGGTTRLKLPEESELLIGRGRSEARLEHFEKLISSLSLELTRAERTQGELNALLTELGTALDAGLADEARQCVQRAADQRSEIMGLDQKLKGLDLRHLEPTLKKQQAVEEEVGKLDAQGHKLDEAIGRLGAEAETLDRDVAAARLAETQAVERIDVARQREDFDETVTAELRIRLNEGQRTFAERSDACRGEIESNRNRSDNAGRNADGELTKYASRYQVTLPEFSTGWRQAHQWVAGEIERLRNTELVHYREDAAAASRTAEQVFREDVAVRIGEQIKKMRLELMHLNQILADCPPFTNDEHYRFEWKPIESYRPLYEFIERVSSTEAPEELHLFDEAGSAQQEILKLIDDAARPESADTPSVLQDYRQLFAFDLLIQRDGKTIGKLSQRIGRGSGGEHRTPFYVTAGASLAAAYRVKPGERSSAAALMLIDEPFQGMDEQNTLAAGRFLQELGLQVIMAAPAADEFKVLPLCDRTVDFVKDPGPPPSVYLETKDITAKGRELLASDLPAQHPELIEKEMRLMEQTANARGRASGTR